MGWEKKSQVRLPSKRWLSIRLGDARNFGGQVSNLHKLPDELKLLILSFLVEGPTFSAPEWGVNAFPKRGNVPLDGATFPDTSSCCLVSPG